MTLFGEAEGKGHTNTTRRNRRKEEEEEEEEGLIVIQSSISFNHRKILKLNFNRQK